MPIHSRFVLGTNTVTDQRQSIPETVSELVTDIYRAQEYAHRYQLRDLIPDKIAMALHGKELQMVVRTVILRRQHQLKQKREDSH